MKWTVPECFLIDLSSTDPVLIELISNSPEETFLIGKRIASSLYACSITALRGELGSGKTQLVKGIAAGLGITETITSPTYTIIIEYPAAQGCTFYHIDAYRLKNEEDFEQIGGKEVIHSGGISVIEWSERIEKALPQDSITISLEITGPLSRKINIKSSHNIALELP